MFQYKNMQSFCKKVIEPHIINVRDLLRSELSDAVDYLVDLLNKLRQELKLYTDDEIDKLRQDLLSQLKNLEQNVNNKFDQMGDQFSELQDDLNQHKKDNNNPHKVRLSQITMITSSAPGWTEHDGWIQWIE